MPLTQRITVCLLRADVIISGALCRYINFRLIEEQKRESDEYRRGLEEKRRRRRSIRLVIQRSEGPPRGPTTTTPSPTTTTDQIMLEESEGSENDARDDLAEITSRYATYNEVRSQSALISIKIARMYMYDIL